MMFVLFFVGMIVGGSGVSFFTKDYSRKEFVNYSKRQELYNECMDKIDNHEQCSWVIGYNYEKEE